MSSRRSSFVIVVMGVAGSGKTTIGQALAQRFGCDFADADQFHSQANKDKMTAGIALTDEDRVPWLSSLSHAIKNWLLEKDPHILACSALRHAYRDLLKNGADAVYFVYLKTSESTVKQRITDRTDHYMKANMVSSQFATLEEPTPEEAVIVNADQAPAELVDELYSRLSSMLVAS